MITENIKQVVKVELSNVGDDIVERSSNYVPVKTGFLKSSVVKEVTETTNKIVLNIKYTAPYAIYVHENLTNNHPNGGQAKFLERAVKEVTPDFMSRIKNALKDALLGK
jgi:hypothetical protein